MKSYKIKEIEERQRTKGSDRILINTMLAAVSIAALAVMLDSKEHKLNAWSIAQLAMSIPFLITSSLAYAKTCYRHDDEYYTWDVLGWFGHSVGYIMMLNAIAIILYSTNYKGTAWLYLLVIISLYITYSVIDIMAQKYRLREKGSKLLFYLLLIFIGSVLPILIGWI